MYYSFHRFSNNPFGKYMYVKHNYAIVSQTSIYFKLIFSPKATCVCISCMILEKNTNILSKKIHIDLKISTIYEMLSLEIRWWVNYISIIKINLPMLWSLILSFIFVIIHVCGLFDPKKISACCLLVYCHWRYMYMYQKERIGLPLPNSIPPPCYACTK